MKLHYTTTVTMNLSSSLRTYQLNDFYNIMNEHGPFVLSETLTAMMKSIDREIVPIVVEKQPEKHYKKPESKAKPKREDVAWDNIRSFKTTKIDKKEGKDKIMSDIRACLNKMSAKNYDAQKTEIFALLKECEQVNNNDNQVAKNTEDLLNISQTIFDIASTNRFYAEIYAKFYKELIEYNVVFGDVLNNFLSTYTSSIKDMHYADPEVDYEAYCNYNKKNDTRKATAMFIIHLMKENIIPVLKVMSICVSFQELSTQMVDEENRTNEVDEIAEIIYLFMKEGIDVFSNCKAEWIWKFVITKHIHTYAKLKKNDKKSISSRAIFKYKDMVTLLEKE